MLLEDVWMICFFSVQTNTESQFWLFGCLGQGFIYATGPGLGVFVDVDFVVFNMCVQSFGTRF